MNTHTSPGIFKDRLPVSEPTLKEAAEEAVEADRAFAKYASMPMTSDSDFTLLEGAAMDAREALYAAFAKHGIDKELVRRIGGIL